MKMKELGPRGRPFWAPSLDPSMNLQNIRVDPTLASLVTNEGNGQERRGRIELEEFVAKKKKFRFPNVGR